MDEIDCVGEGACETVVEGATPEIVGIRVACAGAVEDDTSGTGNDVVKGVFVDVVDVIEV